METAPTTEAVYQGVYALYNNTDAAEQEKASKWLEQLQNSVSKIMFNVMCNITSISFILFSFSN